MSDQNAPPRPPGWENADWPARRPTLEADGKPASGFVRFIGGSPGMVAVRLLVVSLVVGAILFAALTKRLAPRVALIGATFLVAVGYLGLVFLHDNLAEFLPCMVIAGFGCGALVAALPATAAAAAPPGQTGIASGLTNTTKTLGGALSSAVFGIVLATGLSASVTTAASLSGYLVAWGICAAGALVAALLLFRVPKGAFGEPDQRGGE